ncbi:hypothetical protein [Candidatus Solincola tengchongensis]|uniref:hypothetical protein n=1 Tax=Candidatus Solincola tengchongensis TaxID=2900693 RepID=UPI002579ED4D|nr:hypothetical protein [Candidatus Solincola tengchongensis]
MNNFFRKQVENLVRFYFRSSYWSGMPEADPESQSSFIIWFLRAGAPEFRFLYWACLLGLHLLSLLLEGKTFNRLSESRKEELMDRLLSSRNPLLRGIPVLLSLPVLISYYRRDEVRIPLGFDPQSLKRDAELHPVSRGKEGSPKEEMAGDVR